MIPSVPAEQINPIENARSYPALMRPGYMIVPIASIVTIDDPEIAANTAHARTAATARPPGTGAVSAIITLIRRWAMAPRVISAPASRNIGIASRTSRSTVNHMSCTRYSTWLFLAKKACTNAVPAARISTTGWRKNSKVEHDAGRRVRPWARARCARPRAAMAASRPRRNQAMPMRDGAAVAISASRLRLDAAPDRPRNSDTASPRRRRCRGGPAASARAW